MKLYMNKKLFKIYLNETLYEYQSTLDDVQSTRTIMLAFFLLKLFPMESH